LLQPAFVCGTAYAREQKVYFILVTDEESGYLLFGVKRVVIELFLKVIDAFGHFRGISPAFAHAHDGRSLPDHGQYPVPQLIMKSYLNTGLFFRVFHFCSLFYR
jgi:hypothetical protein